MCGITGFINFKKNISTKTSILKKMVKTLDKRKDRILIARDPVGVKPLFYTIKDNTFIFGSEIKTLLANPLVDAVLDEEGLTELFSLGPAVLPGSGILKDIKELSPGELCIIDKNYIKIKEYWHLEAKEFTENLDTTLEHTKYLLIDAIKGDVPLCTFLSGGLDSSII